MAYDKKYDPEYLASPEFMVDEAIDFLNGIDLAVVNDACRSMVQAALSSLQSGRKLMKPWDGKHGNG